MHPFTRISEQLQSQPRVIVEGKGVRVRDAEGRAYLDGMAGLWCVNVGYGRPELVEAARAQLERLPFFHSFAGAATEPAIRLAARLVDLAPRGLSKVFFGTSGSDANETLIKLARHYHELRGKPRKKKVIARKLSYHGVTLGAASLTGLAHVHAGFDLPLPGFLHVSEVRWPARPAEGVGELAHAASLAAELDECIRREGADTVAAFIAEPIMGAGGVLVPPGGYFDGVREVLHRHDVLLCIDEVITGFGRLGQWFGSEVFEIEPELMSVAKGLTSGYIPMSACLISERIWEVLRDRASGPLAHGYTYSGHPVAAATALANLDLIERDDLCGNARSVGAYLQMSLRETLGDHPLVGEIRGSAMIAAVEVMADARSGVPFDSALKVGVRLAAHLADRGLLSRPLGDSLALSPPLVLCESEVDELVERFRRGLGDLAEELLVEGTWKPR